MFKGVKSLDMENKNELEKMLSDKEEENKDEELSSSYNLNIIPNPNIQLKR